MYFLTQNYLHILHIFGKQILFFFNLKTSAILDLWVKYGINCHNDLRNDTKSHKKHKLHSNVGKILNLIKYLFDDLS